MIANETIAVAEINNPVPEKSTPTQSEDDVQTRTMCTRLFDEAKKGREGYVRDWDKYKKFYIGEHWDKKRPEYRASPVINLIFSNLRLILPLLTDSRPQVVPLPTEPSDQQFASILKDLIDYKWSQSGWDEQLERIAFDQLLYGTGFWRVEWDKEAEHGLGDILIEAIEPINFYPDPYASDIDSANCRYVIYNEPITVGEAKRQYPEFADKFYSADPVTSKRAPGLEGYWEDSTINPNLVMAVSRDGGPAYTGQIFKRHFWLRDTTTEEVELTKEDGTKEPATKLKYPKGRYIVYIGSQKVEDRENPYEDGRFPFVRWANYILPREFWGMSEVKQLISPQQSINKLVAYILDNVNLLGNGAWIVDSNAGIDTDNLTNQPGLIIEKNPGSEVRRDMGLPMPPSIFGVLDRYLKLFDTVGGIGPEVRGRFEGGITSGYMLQGLQEAAQVPIRSKERTMVRFLTQAGQLICSRIMQFYSAPRIVRIVGQSDGIPQYFQFYITENEQGEKVARYTEIDQMGQPGNTQEMTVKGMPDIKITSGTSMPFAKAQKAEMSLQLQKMGDIDRQEVLKAVQWPSWQEVDQRMKQEEQQKIAMMQAQGGNPDAAQ